MLAAVVDPVAQRVEVVEVADPQPGPGQLLVRVRSAALNRSDVYRLRGDHLKALPGASAQPFVGGREVSGEVVALGPQVTEWKVGDAVFGYAEGFAELAVVGAGEAFAKPDAMTWDEAAALPIVLTTTHYSLVTLARMAPGAHVLITAGTSGVGVVGAPVAALLGAAQVIVTSRSAGKLQILVEHLADLPCPVTGVDTSREDLAAAVRGATAGHGADVTLDVVGGPLLKPILDAVALDGRIVSIGRTGGRYVELDLDDLARTRAGILGTTFRNHTAAQRAEVVQHCVRDLGARMAEIHPRIAGTYPLADAAVALADIDRDEHVGKLVLHP